MPAETRDARDTPDGYHLRNPDKPLKALWEALRDSMGVNIIMAVIADPRCGLERCSNDSEGDFVSSTRTAVLYSRDGYTPLELAAFAGRADVVRGLLWMRSPVSNSTSSANKASGGHSPLYVAALGGNIACMEMLIGKGANVNSINEFGVSPIYAA
eukprot:PhF_6_TR5352/c0_g1_i1/m.7702